MLLRYRQSILVAFTLGVLVVNACGDVARHTSVRPEPVKESVSRSEFSLGGLGDALTMVRAGREANEAAWVIAVAKNSQRRGPVVSSGSTGGSSGIAISTGSRRSASGASCPGQMGELLAQYFPEALDWATRTVKRESGCNPRAVNNEGCDTSGRTNSHALGAAQMCYPLHADIFAAVGCSDPLDAECGVKAFRRLYDGAGRAPWGG